jgi:hypothetical protein
MEDAPRPRFGDHQLGGDQSGTLWGRILSNRGMFNKFGKGSK